MKKLMEQETILRTKITTSTDGTKTYALSKTVEGLSGGKGIFVLLYPTRTVENIHVEDSTNVHLLNHLKELELSGYVIVNLFATVTQSKLSTRGLLLDTGNLDYIKNQIFKSLITSADKVIIAWGNSHQTSKVVNRAKLEILDMWKELYGKETLYQLTTDGLPEENAGVHPLYMGIRYANATWRLEQFPVDKAMAELERFRDEAKKESIQNSQPDTSNVSDLAQKKKSSKK